MNEAHIENQIALEQEEYETRVLYFKTDFKNGKYISSMENGFSATSFKGTQKEYDEATKMYQNHDNGKIIGTHSYATKEELMKANGVKKYPHQEIDYSDINENPFAAPPKLDFRIRNNKRD